MTKKQVYKLLKGSRFDNYSDSDPRLLTLCNHIHPKLNAKWNKVWEQINTENKTYVWQYFEYPWAEGDSVVSLLRLLTLHMFIEDNYK